MFVAPSIWGQSGHVPDISAPPSPLPSSELRAMNNSNNNNTNITHNRRLSTIVDDDNDDVDMDDDDVNDDVVDVNVDDFFGGRSFDELRC